VISWIHLDPAA